jgi:hypothetical protein
VWSLLAAIQISLYFREPSLTEMELGLVPFLYCLLALTLVAYASGLPLTRRHLGHWLALKLYTIASGNRSVPVAAHPSGTERGQLPERLAASLAVRALSLVIVVLLSMVVFLQLPVWRDAREQWWQRSVNGGLTLWPGPTIFVLAIALVVIFWQSEWRQLTPAQARLVLRSAFVSHHYRDLKMIVNRRLKADRKNVAKDAVRQSAADRH